MKLRLIAAGILIFLLIGTVAYARSISKNATEDICPEEMMGEHCTDEMKESGSCDMMMQGGHCNSMMESCADEEVLSSNDSDLSMMDSCPMMLEDGSSGMMSSSKMM